MSPDRVLPWVVRAGWAALPLVAGPALAEALDSRSREVQVVASVGAWAGWAVVLCAALILHPLSLTAVRAGAAAAPATAAASAFAGASGGAAGAALVAGTVVVVVALLPEVAVAFVNGPAYPNERRFPLRPPAPVLFGPIVVAWGLCVALPAVAALLLAAANWAAGSVALVIAVPSVVVLGRALHTLSRRWVVFVPAGVVLHDPLTLADPVLFRRREVVSFDLAPADSDALDATAGALGMAVEIALAEPVPLAMVGTRSRQAGSTSTSKVLFAPTRPGAVLREARARRFD
ncbi:MAG TPA: hypothetical protein VFV35_01560 [Acidimicrobiales bacterium]|nr:hypothetical protein [Acidimicrobiales bacterium]